MILRLLVKHLYGWSYKETAVRVAKLFVQEQATADAGVRQQIFKQIHQIYLTEFPFIVLYSPVEPALAHKGTHNYQPGPFITAETINIWEWWCDNGKC